MDRSFAILASCILTLTGCTGDVPTRGVETAGGPEASVTVIDMDAEAGGFRPGARACLAQTIYHEARGEGMNGMMAVGAVVLNRRASVAYPDTVCGVVRQSDDLGRCQFSWACDAKADAPKAGPALRRAREVADALMAGADDPTDGATSFHATRVHPSWAGALRHTATIGRHAFYAPE